MLTVKSLTSILVTPSASKPYAILVPSFAEKTFKVLGIPSSPAGNVNSYPPSLETVK